MPSILSFVLKLIIVYFIIGLLTMWLLEDALYKAIIKKNRMTKEISDRFEYFFNYPLSDKLIVFGLYWPGLLPPIISAAIPWLFF